MADETKEPAATPLGAQILRKLHQGIASLAAEVTKMSGPLDQCEAKEAIGGLVGGLGTAAADIEKHWGKFYKDHDLAAADDAETKDADTDDEKKPDGEQKAEDDHKEPDGDERQIKADDDEEASMTTDEKRQVVERIKRLEAEIRHRERLQRVAAGR